MGGKNYTTTLDQMEWKIKLDFPETYKIITSICKPRSGAKIERRNFRSMNQYQRSTAFLKTLTPVKFAKINNGSRIGVKVLCSKYKVSKNLVKKWIEIFEFETFKIQFKESVLKNKDKIILKIQKNIQYLESLKLSNKIMDSTISLSKFSGIFDCDYYWAEKEFKNQVESTFEIDDNLNAAPSLYRVLLLNMANQNDVLEYVCDQIDLIITDILNAEKKCSINGLILQFQNRMNGETIFLSQIKDQILNKILFFIWHGVVDIKL
ncbi:MAG: hypothetical protein IPP42_09930 [Saprospiraceae bacterium]|nr:hypothetical protein [Saprospiraceae bacterium]